MSGFRLVPRWCQRMGLLGAALPVMVGAIVPAPSSARSNGRGPAGVAARAGHLSKDQSRAAHAIAAIENRRVRCRERDFKTVEMGNCDSRAIRAYEALLRPSPQKAFDQFLIDLANPVFEFLMHGDEAESIENVFTGESAEFARARAAILTGADRRPPGTRRGRRSLDRLFYELPDLPNLGEYHVARRFQLRWTNIRNADCAAHPVPHCAERLDAAMADMLSAVLDRNLYPSAGPG